MNKSSPETTKLPTGISMPTIGERSTICILQYPGGFDRYSTKSTTADSLVEVIKIIRTIFFSKNNSLADSI